MRIRKRQVPLPLSSLSPVPLSDLFLNRSSTVQPGSFVCYKDLDGGANGSINPGASDHQNQTIGGGHEGRGPSDRAGKGHKRDLALWKREEAKEEDEERVEKIDDSSKSASTAPTNISFHSQRSSTSTQGEKSVPLKKRKEVSFEDDTTAFETSNDKNAMNMGRELKIKTNSTTGFIPHQEEDHKVDATAYYNDNGSKRGKKKARGGALMEGSRCSRVNGRGWRCCQQTLVGYSLCEHHLGKGRLRSVTSVRNIPSQRSPSGENDNATEKKENQTFDHVIADDHNDKGISLKKRVMKLGMVKARSINSLLGQTSNKTNVELADHRIDN